MSLPDNPNPPEEKPSISEPIRLPPAPRRRRSRRAILFPGDDERAALLNNMAQRAFPSLEFFIFSLLCGAVVGAGFLLDAQSLLLLGILMAPAMMPWIGLALATVTGSWRLFFLTLAGLLIGSLLVFVTGLVAGIAARIWMPLPLFQANIHTHLWWPNLVVLVVGAVLLVISFVRSEEKPILPSIMLSYELYLPLSAAGFCLGAGLQAVWPQGLAVYFIHFALASAVGIITFLVLRFRPLKAGGYLLGGTILLVALAAVVLLSGLGSLIINGPAPTATPTAIPLPSVTATPDAPPAPTATASRTPTRTPTPVILAPTLTPTDTPTPRPTPVYARIYSETGGGALIRSEPGGGDVLQSLINDTLVEVLPETRTIGSTVWVKILTTDGVEGWILQLVLATATPSP